MQVDIKTGQPHHNKVKSTLQTPTYCFGSLQGAC